MNSIDGPFFKGSTLTYRTETGFRIALRPVFLYRGWLGLRAGLTEALD